LDRSCSEYRCDSRVLRANSSSFIPSLLSRLTDRVAMPLLSQNFADLLHIY
jgi:hypothetical protein